MRSARSKRVGVLLVGVCVLGLAACGWDDGQAYGQAKAKQEWQSEQAAEQGHALRNRLQITQSDH